VIKYTPVAYKGELLDVRARLDSLRLHLSEKIGQHFIVDPSVIRKVVSLVQPGAEVIEIGAGIGHISDLIAQRAGELTAIEIDPRFEPLLEEVAGRHSNVKFIIGDASRFPFQRQRPSEGFQQVLGNIPFHIIEPLIRKLVGAPINEIDLITGDRFATEIQAGPESPDYGKLALITQTFFDSEVIGSFPPQAAYPPPRTGFKLIRLLPKEAEGIQAEKDSRILSRLVQTEGQRNSIRQVIEQALAEDRKGLGTLSKREFHQKNRSDFRKRAKTWARSANNGMPDFSTDRNRFGRHSPQAKTDNLGVPDQILNSTFSKLDNSQVRALVLALRSALQSHRI